MIKARKKISVLIVAAGTGERAGGHIPKQYREIDGRSIIYHTVAAFRAVDDTLPVQLVINPDDRDLYDSALAGLDLPEPVAGGETRQASVLNGLNHLARNGFNRVLIHDAARPFVSPDEINAVLRALDDGAAGALPVLPVSDTVKYSKDGLHVDQTKDRDGLYRALTPQGFDLRQLLSAYDSTTGLAATDDASIAEAAGLDVRMVAGSESNFKITRPEDFEKAESFLMQKQSDIRVGSGFDVHKFSDGDHLFLCGVKIPHSQALAGHSDADVALHAMTDAILGAIGAGDIGDHFPPSDPQWGGASSDRFLRHACDLVHALSGNIRHLDVTIICEAPKVGPHKATMKARVAEILDVHPDRISVKATTTEKLGFTGRGEGIAAQATATIALPSKGF